MAVADYITKDDLKAVRKRVNQMHDALEQHRLPMPPLEP